jgi:hypothetical protein
MEWHSIESGRHKFPTDPGGRPGSQLAVEVLDAATGEPIPGYGAADAVPVKLRFHLTNGDLYSYRIS